MAASNLDNPSTLQYWGSILNAASNHASTAEVWAAIRAQNEGTGQSGLNAGFADVSRLRAAAGAQVRAMESLSRTPDHIALDPANWSVAPYGRDLDQRNTLGIFQVNVKHVTIGDHGEETAFRMVTFRGALPATAGELRDAIDQDSQAMADQYGTEHVSSQIVNIFAV